MVANSMLLWMTMETCLASVDASSKEALASTVRRRLCLVMDVIHVADLSID